MDVTVSDDDNLLCNSLSEGGQSRSATSAGQKDDGGLGQYNDYLAAQMMYIQQHGSGGSRLGSDQPMIMTPGMMPFMMPSYQMMMQGAPGRVSGGSFFTGSPVTSSSNNSDANHAGSPLNLQTSSRARAEHILHGENHQQYEQARPAHTGPVISGYERLRELPNASATQTFGRGQPMQPSPAMGVDFGLRHAGIEISVPFKAEVLVPPKRPLTPYMRFSKQVSNCWLVVMFICKNTFAQVFYI